MTEQEVAKAIVNISASNCKNERELLSANNEFAIFNMLYESKQYLRVFVFARIKIDWERYEAKDAFGDPIKISPYAKWVDDQIKRLKKASKSDYVLSAEITQMIEDGTYKDEIKVEKKKHKAGKELW